jgi:pimeloyl-ACP methyl ester carboxylesterase
MPAHDEKQPQGLLAGQAAAENTQIFRHTSGMANRFKSHMDFNFTRTIAYAEYSAASVGESFAAAAKMVDGDFASYTQAWHDMAKRVEARAWDCLSRGHKVSAREAFMHAATYWRAAGFYTAPKDPFNRAAYECERGSFREAAKLSDPVIEVVNIPYENGKTLPGYFVRGGAPGQKRPTLLNIGGGDTTTEEMYLISGVGAVRRGYNSLSFEVPGQKASMYDNPDLFYRPDTEVQVRYAIDYALTRPEVDPKRIALIGHSVGGYLAPRAAAFERRLAAVIASPVIWAMQPQMLAVLGFDPSKPYPRDMESQIDPGNTTAKFLLEGDFRWRCGHLNTTIAEWIDYLGEFTIEGLEDKIICPVMNMMGEGEFPPEKAEQERLHFAKLLNPKNKFNITTAEEGGEQHCTANNLALKNQVEMDWLDEIFEWTQ